MWQQCLWCWIVQRGGDTCHWCGCEMMQPITEEDRMENGYRLLNISSYALSVLPRK
jgi:hypothetical protein